MLVFFVVLNLIFEFLVLALNTLIAFLSIGERGPRELRLLGLTFLLISFFFLGLGEGEFEWVMSLEEVGDAFLFVLRVKLVFWLLIIVVLESGSLITSMDSLDDVLVFDGDWERVGAGSFASGDFGIGWIIVHWKEEKIKSPHQTRFCRSLWIYIERSSWKRATT